MSDATRDDDIPTARTKRAAVEVLRGTDDTPGGPVRYNGTVVPAWPEGRPTWAQAREWVDEHAPGRQPGRPSTGRTGRRFSVYLDDNQIEALRAHSERTGQPISELVRDAVADFLDD